MCANFAGAETLVWLAGEYTRGNGDSLSAGRDHLNSVDRDDADMS